ncbi:MAG: TraR/DksA C4-type zinc finger protein [Phycisphaerales bacterium]|nr:TraR/DksA C4-type zinc finger protein [Phycisphaerales bacterium]MCI0674231.1 TraR/DksA C4-type zinc finger protein [Phycisphaerales bacterium]
MASKTTAKKSSNAKSARRSAKARATRSPAHKAPHKKPAGRIAARPPGGASGKSHKPPAVAEGKKITRNSSPAPLGANAPSAKLSTPVKLKPGGTRGTEASSQSQLRGGEAAAKSSPLGRGKRTRTVAEAASDIRADSKGYVFINGRRVRMISTKGQLPIKKPRNNGASAEAEAAEQPPIKSIKTKLPRKDLNHYRDLLISKRRELIGDLNAMENEALRSGGGNLSHMPIHMADIGTDTYDQDFMLGLAAAERDQLREIDAALARIEDASYGVCQMTGKPIPKARLDAKPWAKYTIEAARKLEGQWGL